jgi:hypothetical protein
METTLPDSLVDGVGLARCLQVGVGTVDALRKAGRIPFVRVGPKTIRYEPHAVVRALCVAVGVPMGADRAQPQAVAS